LILNGGSKISKKEVKNELEGKLRKKSAECPYCDSEMEFGFLVPVFALDWAEAITASGQAKDNVIRLSGLSAPVNQLPSLHCESCGVMISQYM
jgi:hypothetical protein